MTDRLILTVAILGGTGREGRGLAMRWAEAGYHIIIGSRSAERGASVAADLREMTELEMISGTDNEQAANNCDIAVLTVPYAAHTATLESVRDKLRNKLLVDVTVPIDPENRAAYKQPEAGSAAQQARLLLHPETQVVAAFQNVSHVHLQSDGPVPCDVLVTGDSDSARQQVLQLVEAAGLVGWDAGPLVNSSVVEGFTAVLIGINKRYGIRHAGLRITGEQRQTAGA